MLMEAKNRTDNFQSVQKKKRREKKNKKKQKKTEPILSSQQSAFLPRAGIKENFMKC